MALIEKLSAIGAAIREKNGTEELLTLEQMVVAISEIKGGGEGIAYTHIGSNDDGSFSLTDVEGNKHTLIPTVDENGTITAIEFDGETIELTYDNNGALIAIGDTVTDFSNVIVDEEAPVAEEAYIKTKCSVSGNTVLNYDYIYCAKDDIYFPLASSGVFKCNLFIDSSSWNGYTKLSVWLYTYDESGKSLTNKTLYSQTAGTDVNQELSIDLSTLDSTVSKGELQVWINYSGSGNFRGKIVLDNLRLESA